MSIVEDTMNISKWISGIYEVVVFINPGKNLNDLQFDKFHKDLCFINKISGSNIDNKMLKPELPLSDRKNLYLQSVVSIFYINKNPCAFSLSPFFKRGNLKLLHIGLTMIYKNPGFNLGGFLGVFNATMAYEHFGDIYLTNISSTPSLVESFSEALGNTYPAPDCSLKLKPKFYKEVVTLLKEEYLDKCFPDKEKIHLDLKRFVLISNSSEMGFKTNFHQTSFANKMKYNTFCKTWINYEDEEDLVQVGMMKKIQYVKMKFGLLYFKYSFNKMRNNFKVEQVTSEDYDNYVDNIDIAAA